MYIARRPRTRVPEWCCVHARRIVVQGRHAVLPVRRDELRGRCRCAVGLSSIGVRDDAGRASAIDS